MATLTSIINNIIQKVNNLTSSKVSKVTSIDNSIARFNGTAGEIQDSSVVIDDNGNLNITGTSKRITGDFSNATNSNRVAFQSSVVNGGTIVGLIPNGTANFASFIGYNNSDISNTHFGQIAIRSDAVTVDSSKTGTGTFKPLKLGIGGTYPIVIDAGNNLSLGTGFNGIGALLPDNGEMAVKPVSTGGMVRISATASDYSSLPSWMSTSLAQYGSAASGDYITGIPKANLGMLWGQNITNMIIGSNSNSPLIFVNNSTEKMRIDSAGNVGIGLSNPHAKLGVVHSYTGNTGANNNTVGSSIGIDAPTTTQPILGMRWSALRAGIGGHNYSSQIVADSVNNGALEMYTTGATPLIFGTNSTERMRIDSSGNVGIGNTLDNITRRLEFKTANGGSSAIESVTVGATNQDLVFKTTYVTESEKLRITGQGDVLLKSGTGALGYGTSSGGTVTQLTSKSTAVTLNKPSGRIIMNNAALAAGAVVTFQFNNSLMISGDGLLFTFNPDVADVQINYSISSWSYNGYASIAIKNQTTSTLSQPMSFNFQLIKGALA